MRVYIKIVILAALMSTLVLYQCVISSCSSVLHLLVCLRKIVVTVAHVVISCQVGTFVIIKPGFRVIFPRYCLLFIYCLG